MYNGIQFVINKKYLSRFNKENIDTLDFFKLPGAAKQIYLGVLSKLLIEKKVYFYKINNKSIKSLIFCRYFFKKDLIFADFFLQRVYPYEDDLILLRFSKYYVSLPNRIDN